MRGNFIKLTDNKRGFRFEGNWQNDLEEGEFLIFNLNELYQSITYVKGNPIINH